jgi:hypothetical protein
MGIEYIAVIAERIASSWRLSGGSMREGRQRHGPDLCSAEALPNSPAPNVARGEIIDEEALIEALQRDHLRRAALDVSADRSPAPT